LVIWNKKKYKIYVKILLALNVLKIKALFGSNMNLKE